MNNYNETEELKGLEASQVNGGDYDQGHNLGAAVRNLITEVGDAVGGFFSGLAGY
ncbi:hypothetical protein [Spirosoma utsteinense]|uniref:Bacteriocin n=1 Tax=Spirosoma utsteinense TaxID=2585773 RepID=A0ABR6W3V1_9BACT|nr:hypothetical protein [Spirosoma utsteinense]MBC3788052.1 hypothetical protein [Spirosoma utsteinense]MBC3791244.1 hypothetical protein [Spirosoma utsteinense]